MNAEPKPNSGRKLFFGLFVFPLVIAVGMAVLLCTAVFLTSEPQTPETLIAAIKTGPPGKRWQKAFELSNELNARPEALRGESVMNEIIAILSDPKRYDSKTRSYMAAALSHFDHPASLQALKLALSPDDDQVTLYALWSLGRLDAKGAVAQVTPYLRSEKPELRAMAAYVLGVIGDRSTPAAIAPLLSDPVIDVRWNAALSLARLGDDSGFPVLMKMLQRSELESLRMPENRIEEAMMNASKGLILLRKSESIKILESVSRNDKNLKVRQAALQALKTLKEDK